MGLTVLFGCSLYRHRLAYNSALPEPAAALAGVAEEVVAEEVVVVAEEFAFS